MAAVFPGKGDGVAFEGTDAAVADGGAANVSAEVFDGGGSRTEGLDVDAPVDAPHGGVHLPIQSLEAGAKVPPEGGLESGNRNKERVTFAAENFVISICRRRER